MFPLKTRSFPAVGRPPWLWAIPQRRCNVASFMVPLAATGTNFLMCQIELGFVKPELIDLEFWGFFVCPCGLFGISAINIDFPDFPDFPKCKRFNVGSRSLPPVFFFFGSMRAKVSGGVLLACLFRIMRVCRGATTSQMHQRRWWPSWW